jgi:type I restriction enzyme S subunit
MSKRNENRPGYKKTKVGWLPKEWETPRIKDVGHVQAGRQRSPHFTKGDLRPYLRVENIFEGYVDTSDVLKMRFTEAEFKRYCLLINDILLNEGQSLKLVGRCAVYRGVPNNFCFQNTLVRFRPGGAIIPNFALLLFTDFKKRGIFASIASRTTSIAHLGVSRFASLQIPLPSLPEPKKIAEIFSTWDAAIEQTHKLIDAKKHRKKTLIQQLLTGKKRLPGFNEDWKEYSMGELFYERKDTGFNHLPLLAITGKQGIIPATDIDRKDSSNSDKSKYKRIMPGDIGYNTMRMWQGVSAVSTLEGIVSPAYTICIPNDKVNEDFMGYFFKFPTTINLFWRYSQGLVSDTLNLKYNNFSQIKILVPSIEEQQGVAKVFSSADYEINQLQKKLKALEKQKRGLMQKLLTGEIRVK